jgi:DNA-binding XRE family transcriptional regulator
MNKNLFVGMMKAHGDNQADLANAMGISLQAFNAKLNERNGACFNKAEIQTFKDRYNASAEDIDSIFFTSEVS